MDLVRVAVINTSEDVANALQEALECEGGYEVSAAYVIEFREGRTDLGEFLRTHDPRAIIWDIALPYDVNWRYFADEVRGRPDCADRAFILTTTNKKALESMVGETNALEIVGKPYDLAAVVAAVQRAVASGGRETRP